MPAAAKAQIDASFTKLKKAKIDLIQVHNLGDMPTQLGILKEMKKAGRVRYIGVTSTNKGQYAELQTAMRNEPLDFIGVDYAIDNRDVETSILPLAQERKIGVLVYVPFGRTRLFKRVGDRPVPDWAKSFGAKTWGQFFLKYVIAHPAVTCVTPATSQAKNVVDNLGGGRGSLPDEATRKKMAEFIETLPTAPARDAGNVNFEHSEFRRHRHLRPSLSGSSPAGGLRGTTSQASSTSILDSNSGAVPRPPGPSGP